MLTLALTGGALSSIWWFVVLWFHPALHIRLGWLASSTIFLGGGNAVLIAVVHSIVADIAPDEERLVSPATYCLETS